MGTPRRSKKNKHLGFKYLLLCVSKLGDAMCLVYTTSSSRWLGNAGEDVIDENHFHNCVLTLLVPGSTKGYHCRS